MASHPSLLCSAFPFYFGRCDLCQGWFHPPCVGLGDDCDVGSIEKFVCDPCALNANAERSRKKCEAQGKRGVDPEKVKKWNPYTGVTRKMAKRAGDAPRWRCEIAVGGSVFDLGVFRDTKEAGRAYDDAARECYGDHAFSTNFDESARSSARSSAARRRRKSAGGGEGGEGDEGGEGGGGGSGGRLSVRLARVPVESTLYRKPQHPPWADADDYRKYDPFLVAGAVEEPSYAVGRVVDAGSKPFGKQPNQWTKRKKGGSGGGGGGAPRLVARLGGGGGGCRQCSNPSSRQRHTCRKGKSKGKGGGKRRRGDDDDSEEESDDDDDDDDDDDSEEEDSEEEDSEEEVSRSKKKKKKQQKQKRKKMRRKDKKGRRKERKAEKKRRKEQKASSFEQGPVAVVHNDRCQQCGVGGELLCCDQCNLVYHMACLDPPLKRPPKGDWFCPECSTHSDGTTDEFTSDSEEEGGYVAHIISVS